MILHITSSSSDTNITVNSPELKHP